MKNLALLLLLSGVLFSCNNDDDLSDTELVGTWKLIEVFQDPGDGSGTFERVISEKTITFESDNTISSNGDLCDLGITSDSPTFGIYSEDDMTLTSTDCRFPNTVLNLRQDGNTISIWYPCFEGCASKYIKLK